MEGWGQGKIKQSYELHYNRIKCSRYATEHDGVGYNQFSVECKLLKELAGRGGIP